MSYFTPKESATTERERRPLIAAIELFGVALVAYCLWVGRGLPTGLLSLTVLSCILAVWPIYRWAKTQPYRFPAFEAFMLTTISAYLLPVVNGQDNLSYYDPDVIQRAILTVALFQICSLVTFSNIPAQERRTRFWNEPLFSRDISPMLPLGLWINVAYISISTFTAFIPDEIDSTLRAVIFGFATISLFLIGRLWGEGKIARGQQTGVLLALGAMCLVQLMSLYLITTMSELAVFFLAFISAGRRAPWVTLIVVFGTLSVLHNGKSLMREKYWAEGAPTVGILQVPEFFTEWVHYGLTTKPSDSASASKNKLLQRASLIQMLCLVVDTVPRHRPFLMGDTYANIPPLFVPRIFWANKPSAQETTRTLGIYFGLQDEDSSRHTSIAFGTLAEAYANFGLVGAVMLGVALGWMAKVVCIWTRSSPLLSNGGFLMIILMAWSVQVELPMAVWISSLYQAAICVVLVPMMAKPFL